jgi:hypothetical protein
MATGIRVYWERDADPDVANYEVRRAPELGQPLTLVALIQHQIPGDNWSAERNRFYFDDTQGTARDVYQVTAVTTTGIAVGQTDVFSPFGPTAGSNSKIAVDHNYGGTDALRFVTESGAGIPDADIRVYTKPDYDAGRFAAPVYVVQTDDQGRWRRPAFLDAGMDYVILMEKRSAYVSLPTQITV